ncbi:unnamed protein product [Periconia digitata]|uniref:Putative phospholipase n=1 Tax=Periconia digitata TaxID=1303443 RepID=A0A9W4UNB2_9PLEO|nr:unnamed protein product [Periconia digitata]
MSWLGRFNPTPTFPAYTGPYKVGSVDVETPTSNLSSPHDPSQSPPCPDIPTVAFRMFYPAKADSNQRGVKWIHNPQREVVSAYAKFLGAGNALASLFSMFPQTLYFVDIPVHTNAQMLEPPAETKRWPVMVFSHGLGGSRNAYSHICGSLASHGIVVVAPEHRDGSAPISFVHTPDEKEKIRRIGYVKVPHSASTETYEARDKQLRTRLWEIGLIHDALLKMDEGVALRMVAEGTSKKSSNDTKLPMFAHALNVHEPGAISFAGHSFGAATMVQLAKSIYYNPTTHQPPPSYKPLYAPSSSSPLLKQITPRTPVILLDLWSLPLDSPSTTWLHAKPMPCYASDNPTGGSTLLAILSEAFFKWTTNLNQTKRVLSKPSSADPSQPGPHIFYPIHSAHLSQSDFGVLFPWLTTKVLGAKEPERVLRLNTRAVLQTLRDAGVKVARTSVKDLELEGEKVDEVEDDKEILGTRKDGVRGWVCLSAEVEEEGEKKGDEAKDVGLGGQAGGVGGV